MSEKHLAGGSKCPPLVEDKVRLYSMRFCPYCQRALLVAAAKNIPLDIVNINLKDKPDWYLAKCPGGKVPCVERFNDGSILCESLIVADYFDEAYTSSPQLHPTDPFQKAADRIVVENFGKLGMPFYKLAFLPDISATDIPKLAEEYEEVVNYVAKELEKRGTKFFGGNDRPGMLDYMIWPWFERRPIIQLFHPQLDYDTLRKNSISIDNWTENMKGDSAVQEYYLSPEIHHEYSITVRSGNTNFNMLCKP